MKTPNIVKKGNRYYIDNCWYMLADGNGEFDVYDDGEYEGKYCGSLEYLETLSYEDARNTIMRGL